MTRAYVRKKESRGMSSAFGKGVASIFLRGRGNSLFAVDRKMPIPLFQINRSTKDLENVAACFYLQIHALFGIKISSYARISLSNILL